MFRCPKGWSREARVAWLARTCVVAGSFLANLVIDYFFEDPGQVTVIYLTMRPLAYAAVWLVGVFVIKRVMRSE
ncbi:hypothetical protein FE391_20385 [Nonomuraea sp. KC401]|uniref:hypothetical protein n=1 Tax=unclassified Nonomuraea TaxID=2593643 RepID=UPI0010FD150D|nr:MULTISPECIES: hypothetical protein [unclassified Nonomuraea]NBE96183.1 hypothetical protein [Nonomuraea sp. K271]TLF71118.1 hypothetical protein FE391_20385 [Nonomuraea sp. KC401]